MEGDRLPIYIQLLIAMTVAALGVFFPFDAAARWTGDGPAPMRKVCCARWGRLREPRLCSSRVVLCSPSSSGAA